MPTQDMFMIKRGSALAKLMKQTKFIVIDEAPMMDKLYLEKIDCTLREIMKKDILFGGNYYFILFLFFYFYFFFFLNFYLYFLFFFFKESL